MEEQNNKPNDDVRVARTSEERIAGMLLDTIESFNHYFNIAMGIEDQQLEGGDFGGNVSKVVVSRRASALIASLNCLKQIVRIAKPTIIEVVDLTNPDNDEVVLKAIRLDANTILERITVANDTPSLDDDLIVKRQNHGEKYASYSYKLTNNFSEVVSETEELFEEVYRILFKNGLLTPLKLKQESRTKSSSIR